MNARKLILYFYGIEVVIESDSDDLLKRLALDFSYFTIKAEVTHSVFVKALQRPPVHMSDKVEQIFKSSKVEVFEEYPIRYSLYGSDGMSVWDQNKEQVTLFSVEINLLHEITYLFILSRVGKCLDLEGLHRLHASCVIINDTLVLGMMSSGVGKSTLAAFLLEYPEVSFYSDDSPLINSEGEVLPFPIRFGFQEHGLVPDSWEGKESYTLKRRLYEVKVLYSLKELKPAIGSAYQRKVMLLAKRSEKSNPSLLKVSKLYAVKHIFSEGVVGIGLPILIEYFWQRGLSDFFIKTKIFFSRLWAFGRLLKQSDVYEITLSNDPKVNAEFLINWCKR